MATKKKSVKDVDQVIFLADVHFGWKAATPEWIENQVEYFEKMFFPFVEKQIASGRHPIIVIAGDYFENRTNLDIKVMNVAIDIMERMAKLCPVYSIIGNHDIYKKSDNTINSLMVFKNTANVTVVDGTLQLTLKNDKKILLVSWMDNFKDITKLIGREKDKNDYIVLHTEISGLKMDNGYTIVDGVNVETLPDECKVMSGHIHKRQESKKAMYFGCPYHLDRKDIGNQKGIYTLNIDDDGVKKVFTENTVSPMYVKLNYADYLEDTAKWKPAVQHNYVDVVLTDEDLKIVDKNKLVELLITFGPKRISFIEQRKKISAEEITAAEDMTVETAFDSYVERLNMDPAELQVLKQMNSEYMKRATEDM